MKSKKRREAAERGLILYTVMKALFVLLILAVMIYMGMAGAMADEHWVATVCASGGLNVRTGPGMEYRAACMLADGARIAIIEIQSGWGLIRWENREDVPPMGWASMEYLKIEKGPRTNASPALGA